MPRALTTLGLIASLVGCGGPEEAADPCGQSGVLCTWLGQSEVARLTVDDLPRAETALYLPQDVTFDDAGVAWFPDFNNHRVRRADPDTDLVWLCPAVEYRGE